MKSVATIIALSLGLTLALIASGCHGSKVVVGTHPHYEVVEHHGPPPWAPAHGYRAKYRYYYYPASHVYCDVARGMYFYYEGGGWRVGASLPVGIHIDVHDYVELKMDTDKPYVFHSEVVKRYPPGQAKKMGMGKGKWKWKSTHRSICLDMHHSLGWIDIRPNYHLKRSQYWACLSRLRLGGSFSISRTND